MINQTTPQSPGLKSDPFATKNISSNLRSFCRFHLFFKAILNSGSLSEPGKSDSLSVVHPTVCYLDSISNNPCQRNVAINFTLTLQKSRMTQICGVKGEAVVLYREPLTTKEMWYPRRSHRVNNTVVFRCFQDFTWSAF